LSICQSRLGRSQLSASLIELTLDGLLSGLKVVLSELGDQRAPGDSLSLSDWQLNEQAWHLKCKIDAPGRLDPSRKGAHICIGSV
jgi:hypothetical protein